MTKHLHTAYKCPHCGWEYPAKGDLVPTHDWPKPTRQVCPGSKQVPRSLSDMRPLWQDIEPDTILDLRRRLALSEAREQTTQINLVWLGDIARAVGDAHLHGPKVIAEIKRWKERLVAMESAARQCRDALAIVDSCEDGQSIMPSTVREAIDAIEPFLGDQ